MILSVEYKSGRFSLRLSHNSRTEMCCQFGLGDSVTSHCEKQWLKPFLPPAWCLFSLDRSWVRVEILAFALSFQCGSTWHFKYVIKSLRIIKCGPHFLGSCLLLLNIDLVTKENNKPELQSCHCVKWKLILSGSTHNCDGQHCKTVSNFSDDIFIIQTTLFTTCSTVYLTIFIIK